MEKSLKTIQGFSKAGKILSKIVFIVCIVAAALALFSSLFFLTVGNVIADVEIGGKTFSVMIAEQNDGMTIAACANTCLEGFFVVFAEIFLSKAAETYFKNELAAGTPFTHDGAKEIRKLSYKALLLPIAAALAAAITNGIFTLVSADAALTDTAGDPVSLGMFVAFLLASFIFEYGASMRDRLNSEN